MNDTTPPDGGQTKPARSPIADSRHLLQKVMRRKDLAGPEKYVLCALLSFTSASDGYQCHPSVKTLRVLTYLDVQTIRRCIATLVDAGILVIDRSRQKGHNSNDYTIDPQKAYDGPIPWKKRASKPTPCRKKQKDDLVDVSIAPSGSIHHSSDGPTHQIPMDLSIGRAMDLSIGGSNGPIHHEERTLRRCSNEDDQGEMSSRRDIGGLPPDVKRNTLQRDALRDTQGHKAPVSMSRNYQRQAATAVLDAIIQPEPSTEEGYRYTDMLTDILIRFLTDDPNPHRKEETPRAFLTHVVSTYVIPEISGEHDQYVDDEPEVAWRNVFVFALATIMKRATDGKRPVNRIRAQISDLARHYERVMAGGFVEEDLVSLWNDWQETHAGKDFILREEQRGGI